jgi:RNA polymerase sigma factor (sigma-70 family)
LNEIQIYRAKGGKALGDLHEIYNNHSEVVFKYLMCLCHNADLSEELTQETFYQAVRSIDRYNGECKISVWLCQIAKHSYYKYLEKNNKERRNVLQDNTLHTSPEDELIHSEDKIALYKTIHLLEEPFKEVLFLRILGGLSFKEIGEIQLKNENWARVTFYRAKMKLRERGKIENEQ